MATRTPCTRSRLRAATEGPPEPLHGDVVAPDQGHHADEDDEDAQPTLVAHHPAPRCPHVVATHPCPEALESRAQGRADCCAVPVGSGEAACDDQQQSEREQDALPTLEVGEQGVVEDLARGAEDGARELVDEQLAPDREAQGQQDSIGGDHCSDQHAHPWATSGQHEGEEVEHGDDGKHPDGHRVAEGIDGAELLELVGLHQHDLPVGVRDGDVLDQGQPASDEPLLHLLDDLVDIEDELVALDRDGPRPTSSSSAHRWSVSVTNTC